MRIQRVLVVAVALVLQTALIWPIESVGGQDQDIQWVTNFDEALARAKAEKKPVYLDFFSRNGRGWKGMDAGTDPNHDVISFIGDNVIPMRVRHDEQPLAG